MFLMYKKISSPETSPVLGPVNASPPNASPIIESNGSPINGFDASCNDVVMEPFSLYSCCCSSRSHNTAKTTMKEQDLMSRKKQHQIQENVDSKYEFGHATHYVYNATTPRLICAFETFETATPSST